MASELMTSLQSLNTLHLSLLNQVVSYFLACTFDQTLGATDFPCAVNHAKRNTFVIAIESQQQGILKDIVHCCSGVAYPFLIKQDLLV